MSSDRKEYFISKNGWMRALRYDMSSVGDVIEKYWWKGPDTEHTTIVVWGKVRVNLTREDPVELQAGDIVDWPAGVEYEWVALEAPVRFVHIFGPNAGLAYYNRLCPQCKAIKPRNLLTRQE